MRTFSDSKLQEAYERGFQNGFSMALVEKDSDTLTDNFVSYDRADQILRSYVAAFLVFRDNKRIRIFLKKVYDEFYSEWADKSFQRILKDLDKRAYKVSDYEFTTKIKNNDEILIQIDTDARLKATYARACMDLFVNIIQRYDDTTNTYTDRTIGDIRKLIDEAKKLARELGLSHKEISNFYTKVIKDTKYL